MTRVILGTALLAFSLSGCALWPDSQQISESNSEQNGQQPQQALSSEQKAALSKIGLSNHITAIDLALNEGNGSNQNNALQCNGELEYLPQPAIPTFTYTDRIIGTDSKSVTVKQVPWPSDTDKALRNQKIHNLLTNIASNIAVREVTADFSLGGIFSGKTRRYNITIDFMKYRTDPVYRASTVEVTTAPAYYARIGAGLRAEFDIHTTEAGFSPADLIGIAASVKAGNTVGTMATSIVGVQSPEITLITPFTADISDASISRLIEALSTIKAKIHEPDAHLDPQFLARLDCVNPEKGKVDNEQES